jgi:hypothetical protein
MSSEVAELVFPLAHPRHAAAAAQRAHALATAPVPARVRVAPAWRIPPRSAPQHSVVVAVPDPIERAFVTPPPTPKRPRSPTPSPD